MAIQAQMYPSLGFAPSSQMDNALCFISQEQQLMHRVQPEQTSAFSQALSGHAENQRIEIDMYINSQNERLRMALQEQRKQQMRRYESRVRFLIAQKEMEIEEASRRSAELHGFLRRMESESQNWQRVARENESMAASLTGTIQKLREAAANDDAGSYCGPEIEEGKGTKLVCRCCGRREARVIMLPCRHLCSCTECDAFIDSCPVCVTPKKASVEAFF